MCDHEKEEREPLRALSLGDVIEDPAVSATLQALTTSELGVLRDLFARLELHHCEKGPGTCPIHGCAYQRIDDAASRHGWSCAACYDIAAQLQLELRRRPEGGKRRWYRNHR